MIRLEFHFMRKVLFFFYFDTRFGRFALRFDCCYIGVLFVCICHWRVECSAIGINRCQALVKTYVLMSSAA